MIPSLLAQAIREKKRVIATYDTHHREFCPHVLGFKGSELRVFVYQCAGMSNKGTVFGEWKCFVVSNLSNVSITSGIWRTDIGHSHSRSQSCIDTVTVQVPF